MDTRIVSDTSEKLDLVFWKNALKINTSIPAIIDEFDPENQTVSATPAIKAKFINLDGEVSYVQYPKIVNIPLALQRGNGLIITYPVKKGDICTLIFSQRSIDNFVLTGEISNPYEGSKNITATLRCLDMSDAMCFPGIVTTKSKIIDYATDAVEIRNEEGTTKISLSEKRLNLTQDGASITLESGNVTINAAAVTINGKDWNTHMHVGVTTGGGNTGGVA